MKRSHMVLKIAESLIEPHFPEDPMKEADVILRRLENAGMTPPLRRVAKPDWEYSYIDESPTYPSQTWEPEDEEK